MDWDEYIKWGEEAVKWGSNYRKTLRDYPVRSQNKPGETFNSLPSKPPEKPESIEKIFDDFKKRNSKENVFFFLIEDEKNPSSIKYSIEMAKMISRYSKRIPKQPKNVDLRRMPSCLAPRVLGTGPWP